MQDAKVNEQLLLKVENDVKSQFHSDRPMLALKRFEIVKIAERLPPNGMLLDVGCGPGFVPRYFHALGAKVISVDYPAAGGFEALKVLADLGMQTYYLQVGVDTLPLAADSVDVVFAGNVIEHLPHSPKFFVTDLKRVLKPGGHLIIDTKNALDLKTRLKLLLGVSNWAPLESFYELPINPHHHKEYTLAELRQVLDLAGFQNITGFAAECFFQMSLKRFRTMQAMGKKDEELSTFGAGFNALHPYEYARVLLLLLTRIFPALRSDIMVVGQKVA